MIPTERAPLQQRLHEQLHELGLEWKERGQKTIILVDGLDHIQREYNPDRSLIKDLPLPADIPDGVLIVLGSQTDQLDDLPPNVLRAITGPSRRVQIDPISRDGVRLIVRRSGMTHLNLPDLAESCFVATCGHPLALTFLIDELLQQESHTELISVLDKYREHGGSVQEISHAYWRSLEKDAELSHLLGLIVRCRRQVDIDWLSSWNTPSLILRLKRSASCFRNGRAFLRIRRWLDY